MKCKTHCMKNASRLKSLFLIAFLLLIAMPAFSQVKSVTGTVTDSNGQTLVGVSVVVDGTQRGVITDLDGKYTISDVPSNALLNVTYLGMHPMKVKVSGSVVDIRMEEDSHSLTETVVIGYGSAKAKDLTAPITVIKGDELLSVPSATPMSALQGKVAGVNVINNGAPGEGPIVQIRGVGSFGDSNQPLYVVDGMFYDNINFLNNADIQEMSILKDASAAAIYGVRAANGVVIITTKKGKRNQKAQISYDGYFGIQKASNVLKLANSQQYATMLLEGNYNAYSDHFKRSIDKYGGSYADADFHNWTFAADSDWYDELLRTASITNHSLSITGGSDKAVYAVGGSYLYQDGIMDVENNYKRLNFRGSLDVDATDWLKVGFNAVFSNSTQEKPNNATWRHAFNAPPIIGLYDETNKTTFPVKYGSPEDLAYTANFHNPLATANYYNADNTTYQVLSNFYAQINIIPGKLFFKTNYAYSFQSARAREFTPKHYVSSWQQATSTKLKVGEEKYYNYIWDNTLTYNEQIDKHGFGVLAGYSMRQEDWRKLEGTANNVPEGSKEIWYIKNGNANGATVTDDGYKYRGLSYFTRLNYNYDDRYLLMFTMRADGSSKYQEHWGYFPSVGAAWTISQEPFMKDQKWANMLKLRTSWGKLGNAGVKASDGFAARQVGNAVSGVFGPGVVPGTQSNTYFSWLKWEVVDEWNVGVNFRTLQNRLDVDLDYYHRTTHDAVISPRIPFENKTLAGNYGEILNSGIDVSANWSDEITKDWSYNVGVNISTLRNRVKDLNGYKMIKGGQTVNIVGEQMNSFYGFKVEGIYQTPEEVAADPVAVANNLQPGDFKYTDINGDDKIDANDRVALGAYIPNFTYGINLGMSYKNLDFQLTTYGQTGAQMFNRKRALRYSSQNYNFDRAQYENRWTGAGSTNTHPSAAALLRSWNVSDQKTNSYFVEDMDFFRIQNITLGYSFRNVKMGNYVMPNIRLSFTADRPFTSFDANSFSPELSDAQGWDTEVYPMTSTYTFGLRLDF